MTNPGTTLKVSFLESSGVLSTVKNLIPQSDHVDIAVAFLKYSGYQSIKNEIMDFLNNGHKMRLIVGLSGYCITDPDPLEDLLRIKNTLKRKNNLKMRYYSNVQFHPKLLIFKQRNVMTVIVGSSNLTKGGWGGNLEANVLLHGRATNKTMKNIDLFYRKLWNGGARKITFDVIKDYQTMRSRSYHWNEKRIKNEKIKRTRIPLPRSKAIDLDIAYILGMLMARGEVSRSHAIIRIPCRRFITRQGHINFVKRKLSKIIISSLHEKARISVDYNTQTSAVEVTVTSHKLLKIARSLRIPVNTNLGVSGKIPRRILIEGPQVIKSFLMGYGDSCATVDRHISGRARVVFNLPTLGEPVIEPLIDAFQKCSVPILDVNLPQARGVLGRRLRNRVTVTGGTRTPQIRIWGDLYYSKIGFRNTYTRSKLETVL